MNDIEINTTARAIMDFLRKQGDPTDALAILVCTILIYYEQVILKEGISLDKFADGLKMDMLHFWPTRNIPVKGPDTIQ
jgi:hypothetical protein